MSANEYVFLTWKSNESVPGLLYLHRNYFARALQEQSPDPLRHQYAPSVLAAYRSACRLLLALKGLCATHHNLTSHIGLFWPGILSSCVSRHDHAIFHLDRSDKFEQMVFGALVIESPGCAIALKALHELRLAVPFDVEGTQPCLSPSQLVSIDIHR